MIVFSRVVESGESEQETMYNVKLAFFDSCALVNKTMQSIVNEYIGKLRTTKKEFPGSYADWVKLVLAKCTDEVPTPFSIGGYASQYSLSVGADYFNLRIPHSFGFGIKVIIDKDYNASYKLSVTFYGDNNAMIQSTNEYKDMVKRGWQPTVIDHKKKK